MLNSLDSWSDLGCTTGTIAVASGATSYVSLDTSSGQLRGYAAVNKAMSFSLQTADGSTATSNSATVEIFDCKSFITFSTSLKS